jgi:hypothetical protein
MVSVVERTRKVDDGSVASRARESLSQHSARMDRSEEAKRVWPDRPFSQDTSFPPPVLSCRGDGATIFEGTGFIAAATGSGTIPVEGEARFLLKVNGRRPTRGMSSQLDYEMRMVGDYVRDIFESGDG